MRTNAPAAIAVAVVHNKLKPKDAELPPGVVYMAGEDVPPKWYQHTHLALALAISRSLARSLSFTHALSRARSLSRSTHTHHTPHTHRPLFARPPCQSICTNNEHALSLHTRSLSIAAHTHGASLDTRACSGVFVCVCVRERRFPLALSWHMGQLLPLPPSLLSQCPCVCM